MFYLFILFMVVMRFIYIAYYNSKIDEKLVNKVWSDIKND